MLTFSSSACFSWFSWSSNGIFYFFSHSGFFLSLSSVPIETFHIETAYVRNFRNLVGQTITQSSLQTIRSRSRLEHFIANTINVFYSATKAHSLAQQHTHGHSFPPRKHIVFIYLVNGFNLFIFSALFLFWSAACRHTLCTLAHTPMDIWVRHFRHR